MPRLGFDEVLYSDDGKYRIYLPPSVKKSLRDDAEAFEIVKKDGSTNLNELLKRLIANYFNEYKESQDQLLKILETALDDSEFNTDEHCRNIVYKMTSAINKKNYRHEHRMSSVTLTINIDHPNPPELYSCMQEIKNKKLTGDVTLSQYLREMILSYCSKPSYERERVILQKSYKRLKKAIKGRELITMDLRKEIKGKWRYQICPYDIVTSKQQRNNYVLCYMPGNLDNRVETFRLSDINENSIDKKGEHVNIPEQAEKKLIKIRDTSPQFADDCQMIKVLMTDVGIEKYKRIYTNRPDIDHIDELNDHIYWFYWSEWAMAEYLKKFGKEAIVLEPENMRNQLQQYYSEAGKAYINIPNRAD